MASVLKKTNVNLELLTDIDMLLMIEAGIRGGMCQSVHRYAKANNKYMKNYDKSIESSYLMCLDANNLYRWAMSQKLPVNGFKWEHDLLRFNERFIKNYNENSDIGYFLEIDVEYPKTLFGSHKIFTIFTRKKKNRKSRKTCLWYKRQIKICHSHKSFKTSTKPWINTKKST